MVGQDGRVRGIALLAEVAAVLARHGGLLCTPDVCEDDGMVTLTVAVHPEGQEDTRQAFDALELMNDLHYLRDICQLRALAQRFDIPAAALEALLPNQGA